MRRHLTAEARAILIDMLEHAELAGCGTSKSLDGGAAIELAPYVRLVQVTSDELWTGCSSSYWYMLTARGRRRAAAIRRGRKVRRMTRAAIRELGGGFSYTRGGIWHARMERACVRLSAPLEFVNVGWVDYGVAHRAGLSLVVTHMPTLGALGRVLNETSAAHDRRQVSRDAREGRLDRRLDEWVALAPPLGSTP